MVLKINHKELKEIVKQYYNKKLALFLWGTFGIGKSQEILETAKKISKRKRKRIC